MGITQHRARGHSRLRRIGFALVGTAAIVLVGCGVEASTAYPLAPREVSDAVPPFLMSGGEGSPTEVPFDSCQGQWTVPSPLLFNQGNLDITLYLTQNGQRISGQAGYKIGSRLTTGRVNGGIEQNRFFARIYWTQGGRSSIGVYIGEISSSSWIFQGRTYDELATPAKITDFNSSQSTPFYCAPLPGYAEVVRRAVPAAQYQAEFDRFTKAGYRPIWVDGFRAEGQNWFNVIFRPEDGTPWVARHNLTSQQYQTDFDSLPKEGYRPLYIESYPTAEGTRYASIFVKADGPPWLAYHNRGPADHQANFNQRIAEGWVPTIISVTRAGGERRYTPGTASLIMGCPWTQHLEPKLAELVTVGHWWRSTLFIRLLRYFAIAPPTSLLSTVQNSQPSRSHLPSSPITGRFITTSSGHFSTTTGASSC